MLSKKIKSRIQVFQSWKSLEDFSTTQGPFRIPYVESRFFLIKFTGVKKLSFDYSLFFLSAKTQITEPDVKQPSPARPPWYKSRIRTGQVSTPQDRFPLPLFHINISS
jgi:hypothetical protein